MFDLYIDGIPVLQDETMERLLCLAHQWPAWRRKAIYQDGWLVASWQRSKTLWVTRRPTKAPSWLAVSVGA